MGAQELQFPALLPREPYEATGRWAEYGDGIFRLEDRKGADYLLGPTHEELFTLVVKDLYSSYKDLPVWLFQIQTEVPRRGAARAPVVLRGREFIMKDSYSFDLTDEGLDRSYAAHRAAYVQAPSTGSASTTSIVTATSGRHGRLEVRGVPRQGRGRRGHLRPLHHAATTRRQRRGRAASRYACSAAVRRLARRPRRGHPRHPDDPDPRRPPQQEVHARTDRPWHAGRHASRTSW